MIQEFINKPLYAAWPFWALELEPGADNKAIERAYAKLTGAIKLQVPGANTFKSPLGTHTRDEFLLRDARANLTNPETRIIAEFWYVSPTAYITENITSQKAHLDWKKMLRTI